MCALSRCFVAGLDLFRSQSSGNAWPPPSPNAATVDKKSEDTTTMTSSLQRAAAAAINAMKNISLETGLAGIDLSEVTSSSTAPPFPGTIPTLPSASLRDRLDQVAHRRRVQDQQEVQLMAAMQASRTAARMNPTTSSTNRQSSFLGDVIVGMHAVEQNQEPRMKLRKGSKTPTSHATRRPQQQQSRGTSAKISPSTKKVSPVKKKKSQKTKY
jgi:hypothetical protein